MRDRFLVRLWDTPDQLTAFALQQKDGAYLSPTGRLAAGSRAVAFPTPEIAELCLALWMPRLRDRWGDDFRTELEHWRSEDGHADDDLNNTALLLAKARSGRWASNQSVSDEALQAALVEIQGMDQGKA